MGFYIAKTIYNRQNIIYYYGEILIDLWLILFGHVNVCVVE